MTKRKNKICADHRALDAKMTKAEVGRPAVLTPCGQSEWVLFSIARQLIPRCPLSAAKNLLHKNSIAWCKEHVRDGVAVYVRYKKEEQVYVRKASNVADCPFKIANSGVFPSTVAARSVTWRPCAQPPFTTIAVRCAIVE